MKLSEFKNTFLDNEEKYINELNDFLREQLKPSSAFDENVNYDFKWSSLRDFLNSQGYGYSKSQRIFVKGLEQSRRIKKVVSDNQENKNNNFENVYKGDRSYMEDIYKMLKVKEQTKKNTVPLTIQLDKNEFDRLNEYCKGSIISKNKLVSLMVKESLDELDKLKNESSADSEEKNFDTEE